MPDTEPLVPAALELLAALLAPGVSWRAIRNRDKLRARLLEVQAQAAERAVKPWREALRALHHALGGTALANQRGKRAQATMAAWRQAGELLSPTGGDTE